MDELNMQLSWPCLQ